MTLESTRPTRDRLIVEVDSPNHEHPSGILLGAGQIERPKVLFGTVLSVGPKVDGVAPGERIAVKRHHAFLEEKSNGRELILIEQWQVEGVLEGEGYAEG